MKNIDKKELIEGIEKGDIRMLSKAITLAESTKPAHRRIALDIIEHFGPHGDTLRIGITGTPGAGKSSFIETAGNYLLDHSSNKVAVLSIDPSSNRTKGSILGDKTRMSKLSNSERAYIRPTASGAQWGGLAQHTRLAMLLCEAAGFDTILIESVGVGQGETEIAQLTDMFVLLLNPGGGDELQGIKRGIMEMADLIVVNKADGPSKPIAERTAKEYSMALHLMPETDHGWVPKVITASSLNGNNIPVFWDRVSSFHDHIKENDWKGAHRKEQMEYWAVKAVKAQLMAKLDQYKGPIKAGLDSGQLPERIALDLFEGNGE